MVLQVVSLGDLIESERTEEEIKNLLFSFETLPTISAVGAKDVEHFIKEKAIEFQRMDLSRTYLVLSRYQGKFFLAGYFSIANKPLVIPKKQYQKFPTSVRKRLMGQGHKTEQRNYQIKSYLLGQLGKNYSQVAKEAGAASGSDILELAQKKVKEAYKLMGGRILYLECEDNEKITGFYEKNGYSKLNEYESPNGLVIMVKKLSDIE
ncbi:hypothetical protein [Alkalicoccus chagannorensis]|uniref:hypothetical protein n=1 Tax=Alkalicoccus chagannorensis TaxID=427072 RepID=UPI00047C6EF8|nr:hypothetical protein [Alkalicoccus chagannorensis]